MARINLNSSCILQRKQLFFISQIVCSHWLFKLVYCDAPPPVVCSSEGGCTVSNAYGVWNDRISCQADAVAYPKTEEELLAVVSSAAKRKQKMKVVTKWSHSIPKWTCPGGTDGLLISTEHYTKNIVVNVSARTVTVDSGVGLREIIDTVARSGLALRHSPYWQGVSIGGLLSTGSHGSSLFGKGSAVHEYILQMTLVVPASEKEGYARVVTLTRADEDLKAAQVSLGVLGVISQVTLELEPLFKRSITYVVEDDKSLEDDLLPFAMAHEFGDVTWHPSQYHAIYRKDDRVPINTPGDGVNDFIGFRPQNPVVLKALRDAEELFERTRNAGGKCALAGAQVAAILAAGLGLKNDNKSFTHYPVTGFQNRMQASGSCLAEDTEGSSQRKLCGWDSRVGGEFFYESAFLISVAKIQDFIRDVKSLREVKGASRFCGTDLYNGLLLRFVRKSEAYLGAVEDSVEVNFNYYRAREAAKPRLDEDVWEEVEQMARYKYEGAPSWSKNRDTIFQGLPLLYSSMPKFKSAMARFDPNHLFSSTWSDSVLGISQSNYSTLAPHHLDLSRKQISLPIGRTPTNNIDQLLTSPVYLNQVPQVHRLEPPSNVDHVPTVKIHDIGQQFTSYVDLLQVPLLHGSNFNKLPSQLYISSRTQSHAHGLLSHRHANIPPLSMALASCALDGLCICSNDLHCAPNQGYLCRPGLIYKDAHVCRYESLAHITKPIEA